MIGQECIDELADVVGLKDHVAAITERAMRGEIAFEPALRERVALLKGLPLTAVDRVIAERITLMPGGRTLVRTLKAHGAYTALVSGGFTLFTGPVAAQIGFDEHRSNRLETEGDRLAGTVAEPIVGARPSATPWSSCAPGSASIRPRPWRWATAPTTWRCWGRRVSAWRSGPSPRWRPQRTPGSTTAT